MAIDYHHKSSLSGLPALLISLTITYWMKLIKSSRWYGDELFQILWENIMMLYLWKRTQNKKMIDTEGVKSQKVSTAAERNW